ncbi:MAG: hypothetical protein OSB05_08115 [Akkermansiaceae bacterium]|nr:hypothetical protein [Akkermansiaceae bacterium]
MSEEPNPYQAPREGDSDQSDLQPFHGWTDRWMVGLFFLPSLALIGLIGLMVLLGKAGSPLVSRVGASELMTCFALLGIGVSVFSAYVNKCRQKSGWAGMALMIVVYLIAQIFALFLTVVIIMTASQIL